MPETTLAGWENRIREYDANNTFPRSTIKKLAKTINKRFVNYNDCDLGKLLQHSDPTADTAVKNVMAEMRLAVAA